MKLKLTLLDDAGNEVARGVVDETDYVNSRLNHNSSMVYDSILDKLYSELKEEFYLKIDEATIIEDNKKLKHILNSIYGID